MALTQSEWEQDWRNRGQETFLYRAALQYAPYRAPSAAWTHDHCEFCWATLSEKGTEDLHEGYRTLDSRHWICEECFADLSALFQWSTECMEENG